MSDQKYPEPVVGLFILNKENKILLLKSHKWLNKYVVPGGHIEVGETIEQAMKREAKEETGLEITVEKYLQLWEFIQGEEFHAKKHMLFLDYQVRASSTDVSLNDEAQEFIWIDPKEALKLPLENFTKLTIEKYLCS